MEEEKKWERERERKKKDKEREKDSRTEGEINSFKQVLSVIYICLQNEKCVP